MLIYSIFFLYSFTFISTLIQTSTSFYTHTTKCHFIPSRQHTAHTPPPLYNLPREFISHSPDDAVKAETRVGIDPGSATTVVVPLFHPPGPEMLYTAYHTPSLPVDHTWLMTRGSSGNIYSPSSQCGLRINHPTPPTEGWSFFLPLFF